jgi:hypothetical protein
MPQAAISVSVYNRWNNASLDSSIAKLYPAGDSPTAMKNTSGSPEGSSVPRAEYFLNISAPEKTRGSRRYTAIVVFDVWGTTKEGVDGYISSIYDAFVNSDSAASNPMTMTGGTILEVDDGPSYVFKDDDALFRGQQTIYVDFSVPQQTP